MKAPHIQTSPTEPDDTNKTSLKEQKSAEHFDSALTGARKQPNLCKLLKQVRDKRTERALRADATTCGTSSS